MPNPEDAELLQAKCFRRYGGTMVQVMQTPPLEAVSLGGWAGVPDLAKMAPETMELMLAWRRSMPHLYSDRKLEQEELQKIAHVKMLHLAIRAARKLSGKDVAGVARGATRLGVQVVWQEPGGLGL